jgi:myosin heavy subunit
LLKGKVDDASLKKQVSLILKATELTNNQNIFIGSTKVFYRNEILNKLEEKRDVQLLKYAVMLQATVRRCLARWELKKLKKIKADSERAIEQGDFDSLQLVFKYAENEDLLSYIPQSTKDWFSYLGEEKRILELLKQASVSRDANQLDAALQQSEKLGIAAKSKKPTALQVIQQARELHSLLGKVRELRDNLLAAIQAEDLSLLKKSLDAFLPIANIFPENDELLKQARELTRELEEEEKPFIALRDVCGKSSEEVLNLEKVETVKMLIPDCEKVLRLTPDRAECLKNAKKSLLKTFRDPLEVSFCPLTFL